ncbi:MAG: biopolymer transporter ExbD [Phycisphaerales bacterium]|nr:biopolymer transporter ExbD [Phycisphaerales bacterium]
MSRIYHKGPARVEANLTAFIDVTFLLIIFFILVAQITTAENAPLVLPAVHDRVSTPIAREDRVIVNCLPTAQPTYSVGSHVFAGANAAEQLGALLRDAQHRRPDIEVSVRADRTAPYGHVHPAMQAAAMAGIQKVQLIIVPPEGEL